MSYAERNRQIKTVLEAEFGRGKVQVNGSRGTARGWVHVNIDMNPSSTDHHQLHDRVIQIITNAGIKLNNYYTDMNDYSDCIIIEPRDFAEEKVWKKRADDFKAQLKLLDRNAPDYKDRAMALCRGMYTEDSENR